MIFLTVFILFGALVFPTQSILKNLDLSKRDLVFLILIFGKKCPS